MVVRIYDGAVGTTRLAQAEANAELDNEQRLSFSMHLAPADLRQTGHVDLAGSIPLMPPPAPYKSSVVSLRDVCGPLSGSPLSVHARENLSYLTSDSSVERLLGCVICATGGVCTDVVL